MRLGLIAAALLVLSVAQGARAQVTGAGSTFAEIVLSAWAQAYQRTERDAGFQPVGAALDYEPIGSQGGILRAQGSRAQGGGVDLAATDVPLPAAELERLGLAQFPIVMGGVVVVASLPGVAGGELRLSGELLADIHLGSVTRWADPAIAALNPGRAFPDLPIAVVHRADGSGTTFNYTRFLSARSERWQAEIGHDLTVAWPVGMAARGSRGVGETVQRTRGALGYVDLAQARRLGLADARVRNRAGVFVRPSVASFQATAATADWAAAGDFALLLEDTGEPAAYPIPLTVFALMPLREAGTTRSEAALAFLAWALRDGAGVAEGLGYVPLPAPLVEQVEAYWARRLAWAGRPLVAGFTPAGAARD